MSEWGWVLWGYGVALATIALYAWSVVARHRRTRRLLDELGDPETEVT